MMSMVGSALQTAAPYDPFYFSYQRLVFDEDNKVRLLTSNKSLSDAESAALLQSMPRQRSFEISNDGILTISSLEGVEKSLCTYLIQTTSPLAPGDILLTNAQNNQIVLGRQFRKLK